MVNAQWLQKKGEETCFIMLWNDFETMVLLSIAEYCKSSVWIDWALLTILQRFCYKDSALSSINMEKVGSWVGGFQDNIVNGYFGTIVLLPHCMAKVEYEGLGSPSTIFQSTDGIKNLSCCFLFCFLCDEAGFVTSVLVLFGQGCSQTLLSKVFSFSFQACFTKVFLLLKFFWPVFYCLFF